MRTLPRAHLWIFRCFIVLGLLPPADAAERQFLHRHVPPVVARLKPLARVPGSKQLQLAIGLPLRNTEALTNLLRELYDPSSPAYHHYLTPQQFTDRFGPTDKDYQELIRFAAANNLKVTATHPNRVLLDVSGSVEQIEQVLHVNLNLYQHPTESRQFYAPDTEPSLDTPVPILRISGLDNYSLPRPRFKLASLAKNSNASPNAGSGPSGTYMGNDFRSAYVPGSTLTGAGQVVGLLQFDGYTATDISYYETLNGLPSVTLTNVLIDGASGTPSGNGGAVEVSLDIEMAISMAPGLSKIILYEGPSSQNPTPGLFDDVLSRMATDNEARQLSCSWFLPGGGIDTVADQIFQQMAVQGQSFFNASGDFDAFSGPVDFPGEDPYITQVGGTTLTTSGPGGYWASEQVWNWDNGIGSGGGISTRYSIPSWQTGVNMSANQGSYTMRNIPDVAMTADNVYVRVSGADGGVAGTSCAAPLWAGFAALANQQAVASGRPSIGFVNPAVYQFGATANYPNIFHDITTGDNTSPSSPNQFFAVPGYDLCTGWGTPAGQPLIDALAPPPDSTPPSIMAEPQSQTVPAEGQAVFIVTATGSPQLSYAWSFNGTNINGATNSSLVLQNVLPGSAGTYSVQVTNAFGSVTSSNAQLTVLPPVAPVIVTQPQDQTTVLGGLAVFSVVVTGTPPVYQWTLNGNAIQNATNSFFTLFNAHPADQGEYAVQVTNLAGYVTSSSATLTLLAPGTNCDTVPSNLVGWWPANGDAVNIVDGTAALDSPVTFVPGEVGDAFAFNSSNTDVHVGSGYDLGASDGFSIEMWINPSVVNQFQPLLEWATPNLAENDLSIWLSIPTDEGGTGPGSFALHLSDDPNLMDQFVSTPAGLILPNSWQHVAATYDRTSGFVTLYVDGSLIIQTNIGSFRPATTSDLWFGFDPVTTMFAPGVFGAESHYSGLLDEISIYNRVLSPTEIQNIYLAGGFGKCPLPPTIVTVQPASQTATVGHAVQFTASANGNPPFTYQWLFNGTNMPNATNASFFLANVQLTNAGNYAAAVANAAGSAMSTNASLMVLPPTSHGWLQSSAPSNFWWGIASSADGYKLAAVANGGGLYLSTNGGDIWSKAPGLTNGFWESVASSADGSKLVVNGRGPIFVSTNSGADWSVASAPFSGDYAYSSADGTRWVGATVGSTLLLSTNSGLTWATTATPSNEWISVSCSADGVKWTATLQSNVVYMSTNSALSWFPVAIPLSNNAPVSCSSADGKKQTLSLRNVGIYTTTNSGMNWTKTSATNLSWTSVASSADGTRLVASAYGDKIYTSADSGSTWTAADVPNGSWVAVASSADGNRLAAIMQNGWIYTYQTTPAPVLNTIPSDTNLLISWTVPSLNFVLQLSPDLLPGNWTDVTNVPILCFSNLQYQVTLPPSGTNLFFRLKYP